MTGTQLKTDQIKDSAITNAKLADAGLQSFANLTVSADTLPYGTGSETFGSTTLTPFARNLLDDATQGNAQTTLGLGTGDTPTFTQLTLTSSPISANEVVTKAYLDSLISGLNTKAPVNYATIAELDTLGFGNWTFSGVAGGQLVCANIGNIIIDGGTLSNTERVLVKDQTTPAENGIYEVTQAGSGVQCILTRSSDANSGSELVAAIVYVTGGTLNDGTSWVCTTDAPITLNTTAITFAPFSGAGSIIAGAGLTKTGNVLDVGAGTGIQVNADNVQISPSYTGQTSITTVGAVGTGTWQATNVAVGFGGTGASTAAGARTNLGLVIGTDVQAFDAGLQSISGLTTAADTMIYTTAPDVYTTTALTAFGRSLIDDANAAAARTTLGITATSTQTVITRETPSGAINGANVTFVLANTPVAGSEEVYLNGLLQEPGAGNDYTISGATITYLTAPVSGDVLRVSYRF